MRDVALRPVGGVQLHHGVGVGQAGRLLGGQHQQRVGPGRHPAHRAVEAGAEVEQHRAVARRLAAQGRQDALQRRRVDRRQRAGAGAAGDDVEAAVGMVQCRVGQRGAAGDDAAQVLLGVRPSWMSTLASPRSASNSSTRLPCRASAWASVMANQVLPTPPLPEAMAMVRPSVMGAIPSVDARRARQG